MRRYAVEGAARSTAEMRERERLADPERPNMIRKAAEVHRRVRKYAREELLKPGMQLIDICEKLENATRVYLEANKSPTAGTRAGIGACPVDVRPRQRQGVGAREAERQAGGERDRGGSDALVTRKEMWQVSRPGCL